MKDENRWPGGNQCCACLTFDLDAEWVFMGNFPETANMPRRLSLGKYVWQADIMPRIADLLDEFNIQATFFVPGQNVVDHPDVIKDLFARGHEIACHGWRHENIADLPKEEEKKRLLMTADAIEKITGKRPSGNRTAGGELSPHTLELLLENGFQYDSSLRGSDLPYPVLGEGTERLIEVPSYYEMDDFHLFADYPGTKYQARMMSPNTGYEIWTNAFDGYYKYGLCYTTMFHPQIIGKPGGMMLLGRLLDYIGKFPNVWYAKAIEIAEFWREK
jgi:peptidoglycan-N-acetylglucosamine deacetylase